MRSSKQLTTKISNSLISTKMMFFNCQRLTVAKTDHDEANLTSSNTFRNFYHQVNKHIKCSSGTGPLNGPTGELLFNDADKAFERHNFFANAGTTDSSVLPYHVPLRRICFFITLCLSNWCNFCKIATDKRTLILLFCTDWMTKND